MLSYSPGPTFILALLADKLKKRKEDIFSKTYEIVLIFGSYKKITTGFFTWFVLKLIFFWYCVNLTATRFRSVINYLIKG